MQNIIENNNYEIDFIRIIKAVFKKIPIIILCAVIAGGAALGATYVFVEPTYQADIHLYVNNNGALSENISPSSLSAAQELVNTYIAILKTRSTLNEIIRESGVNGISAKELEKMISASSVDSTEVFEIAVETNDPKTSKLIADSIAKVLPLKIAEIVEGSSVKIIDYAEVPETRSGPCYSKITVLGFILGAFLCAAIIAIKETYDSLNDCVVVSDVRKEEKGTEHI